MTRRRHVDRIVQALSDDVRAALHRNPKRALADAGVRMQAVDQLTSARGAGGMCDGLSFAGPRTVLYAPTPDSRRENFTLAHEYGHLLVDADDDALSWLADQPQPGVEQERMCDDIAAALLVPDSKLDAIVGAGPITGQHLVELFTHTQASQVVCAIALARRLGCAGAVLLTDRVTNTVVHAALVGSLAVYPRRGQDLPTAHPLRLLQNGARVCRESFWATPWGQRETYYLNAAATTKRTYSVLAVTDLWGSTNFHAPSQEAEVDLRPTDVLSCRCGFTGNVTGWPCDDCGRMFCPRCKNCDCARRAALTERCTCCTVHVARTSLVNGLCSGCR
jgi:hypothetical protein